MFKCLVGCSISIKYISANNLDLCHTKELFIPSVLASSIRQNSFFSLEITDN